MVADDSPARLRDYGVGSKAFPYLLYGHLHLISQRMRVECQSSALLVVAALLVAGGVIGRSAWAALGFAALLVASLLVHEAAHAAAAAICGVRIKAIGLCAAGAYTVRARSSDASVELLTALAGPLANLLLWIAFSAMPGAVPTMLATCNLILGVSNLLPIPPSDGWRICKLLFSQQSAA